MNPALVELKESRERLVAQFSAGLVSEDFEKSYSSIMDQYFRRGFQESVLGDKLFQGNRPFALVAVGGYGRRELCLQSDIDVMILFSSKIPSEAKDLSNEFFLPLWDLGLDLGYGIRNYKDCLALARSEFEVLTSMMDARFICGDSPLFLSLMEKLNKKVIPGKKTAFGRWLEAQDRIRMDAFGDATYLLEPNLKEGMGGLRDYHHILWLSRALFHSEILRDLERSGKLSQNEYQELNKNLRFIWLVRNHLHDLSGRKNDCLGFEYQQDIAKRLGFQDRKNLIAVEQFLGKLHASMESIKSLHRAFTKSNLPQGRGDRKAAPKKETKEGFHLFYDEVDFDSDMSIEASPHLLFRIFEQSALSDHDLSIKAMRLVREFLYLVDDTFRRLDESTQSFLRILNADYAAGALDQMFETCFLDAFIPEFGHVKDRVQFDTYHLYPVGRHLLETFRYLNQLAHQKDMLLLDTFSDLADPEALFLAGLLHDIGKQGKDHAVRGVGIAKNILKRFKYDSHKTEEILLLIRHHLFLVETATRRDLNDEKVVVQCARTIGTVERLKMLYLLTCADAKATGPRAWNDWVANLVQELFFKILHILEKGELATQDATHLVEETRGRVRRLLKNEMAPQDMEKCFEVMSPQYLLYTTPREIAGHMVMVNKLKEKWHRKDTKAFILETRSSESNESWIVTFLAKDRPGVFSDLAGVLALNNINILSAQIHTWRDGTALDIFRVSSPPDPIHPEKTWERTRKDLENTMKGKLDLAYRLDRKSGRSILSAHNPAPLPPRVTIDNDASDFFTLIEVFADDSVGLLYRITRILFDLRLDIRIAKISTKVDQLADVFYVRDLDGQKVEDPGQVEEIKGALLHGLQKA